MNKAEQIKRIEMLSNAKSPSGFEDEALAAIRKEWESKAIVTEDHVRNMYISYPRTEKPVFMLDAHGDEVGMMVQFIRPNGTLSFLPLGGWSASSFPASKVLVQNRYGQWIPGIIAEKPVHFKTQAEKDGVLSVSDMVIDIGAVSQEDAVNNFGIEIGRPAVSAVDFSYDEAHDIMIGKGFDCRIGVAAMLETMDRLKNDVDQGTLAFDLTAVVSSQEEIGDRGVKVAVSNVEPAVSICFEGCPADDTFSEGYKVQAGLKRGPMIRFMDVSMIANPRYMRDTLAVAAEEGIPVQGSVRSGGGNNGAVINLTGKGVPVIVIGIPVRYIHSHYGIASYEDYENAVRLAVAVIRNMTQEKLDRF